MVQARLPTKDLCTKRLTALGRNGRLPWCQVDVVGALSYISAETFVLVPTAHALLRGVTASLFEYALKTPVTTVQENHPIVFNSTQRKFAQVGAIVKQKHN
jgi:hypothetical protein